MARTENEFIKDLLMDIEENHSKASDEEKKAVIRAGIKEYMKEVSGGNVDPSLIEYLNDVSEENMKKIIVQGIKLGTSDEKYGELVGKGSEALSWYKGISELHMEINNLRERYGSDYSKIPPKDMIDAATKTFNVVSNVASAVPGFGSIISAQAEQSAKLLERGADLTGQWVNKRKAVEDQVQFILKTGDYKLINGEDVRAERKELRKGLNLIQIMINDMESSKGAYEIIFGGIENYNKELGKYKQREKSLKDLITETDLYIKTLETAKEAGSKEEAESIINTAIGKVDTLKKVS